MPVEVCDCNQKPGNGDGGKQILRRTQTVEKAAHRRQFFRFGFKPNEEEQQYHTDLADSL